MKNTHNVCRGGVSNHSPALSWTIVKNVALALFTVFFFTRAAYTQDQNVTIYGVYDYPPYAYTASFTTTGEMKGIYTDILKAVFAEMDGYNITIKPIPWNRGLTYLEQGKGFAIYPPYQRTIERPYIWPYSIPLVKEEVTVFCRADVLARPRPNWPEDYFGLTIANTSGYELGGDAFWAAVKDGKIKIEEADGVQKNILKVVNRRADCYINDRLAILWDISRLIKAEQYVETEENKLVEGATISREYGFLGYTDRDDGRFAFKDDFIRRFDVAYYSLWTNGRIQKIIQDYTQ